jgi:hypothetical protein
LDDTLANSDNSSSADVCVMFDGLSDKDKKKALSLVKQGATIRG